MNMNFKFLLCGAAVGFLPQYAAAQCAITDCLQLGYTSLKLCTGGLKCPFGEYWACPQKQCDTSYLYTCTGANEQLGTDKCGDKYKSCNCASGYEWKDGKCQTKGAVLGECTGYAKNCKIGDILNSDGTCTTDNNKMPLGVVVAIKDNCGYAMTASPIAMGLKWSTESVNTGAFQSSNRQDAIKDFDVSGNMTKIIQSGNSDTYPAAYAALNYAPSAAPTSKGKWMLPTAGILNSIYRNLNAINNTISKLGGTQITSDDGNFWSSSEYDIGNVWSFCMMPPINGVCLGGVEHGAKSYYGNGNDFNTLKTIRPVLAF